MQQKKKRKKNLCKQRTVSASYDRVHNFAGLDEMSRKFTVDVDPYRVLNTGDEEALQEFEVGHSAPREVLHELHQQLRFQLEESAKSGGENARDSRK
jgi:hypothetical protein